MSRIELFKPEHLFEMDLRPFEVSRLQADPRAMDQIYALARMSTGGTLFVNNRIVASFGYYELWPGCFEVWAFPSIHVNNHTMLYLRTVKRYILALMDTYAPRRIQSTSYADEMHNRWMQFLGFTNETPNGMKAWSVLGQTFNMWSIVNEGLCDGR